MLPDVRVAVSVLLGCALLNACAAFQGRGESNRVLPFGCNDIAVVGKIRNGSYTAVDDGGLLGRGWTTARISVFRVVRGNRLPSSLTVRYISHAAMREDADFLFVLTPVADSQFEIATAQRMSIDPWLASHCG